MKLDKAQINLLTWAAFWSAQMVEYKHKWDEEDVETISRGVDGNFDDCCEAGIPFGAWLNVVIYSWHWIFVDGMTRDKVRVKLEEMYS